MKELLGKRIKMGSMKKPSVTEYGDGSIVIEFIDEKKRFLICIELDLSESSWTYVSSLHNEVECELLPDKMIECLKKFYA